jgi:hypothetical protein
MGVKPGLSHQQHGLEVFQNGAMKRIFESKGQEMVGGCRRLHSEELHNLYASPNIIRVINKGRCDGRGM